MSLLVQPCASSAGMHASGTYYHLLEISPDEQDPKVIEEAAVRCSGHIRAYQLTNESECALLLNEIAKALITLLDPVHRQEYDLSLGKRQSPAVSERPSPEKRKSSVLLRGEYVAPAPVEATLVPEFKVGKACDVKLVYRKRAS
jgi:hypothetical protein